MPGPNSAPNGDAGLVKGYEGEEWIFVEKLNRWVSKRDFLGAKMRSGKTK